MNINLISGPDKNPLDIVVGSARTCYSKNLKTPEEISSWDKKIELAVDLFKSGHHTTLQHVNFVFSFEVVSRLSIWRFFHAHRHYNSDQISQRYAAIDKENFYLPKNIPNYNSLLEMHSTLIKNYTSLVDILECEYKKSSNPVEVEIANKKAMENARYVLPQSIYANMYHTVNLSTLLRYYAVSHAQNLEGGSEIAEIINEMVMAVLDKYPELHDLFKAVKFIDNIEQTDKKWFEAFKGDALVNISSVIPGFQGDFKYYSDSSASYNLFALPESMGTFTFKMNLSLSADAQNQRHRTSIGMRPELKNEIVKILTIEKFIEKQYIPEIFFQNKEAYNIFIDSMNLIYTNLITCDLNYAPYILPNSFKIPIIETTSFADFAHKSKMRLCLNAQEEIRILTDKMVNALSDNGVSNDMLVPPCVSRYSCNVYPTCSEGSRFCGIKEWQKDKYKK